MKLREPFMARLEETGEADDTLAFYVSDNGYHWREHGTQQGDCIDPTSPPGTTPPFTNLGCGVTEKQKPYLEAIKIPFLMRWPDNPQALGAFFLAVVAWGILGGAFLTEPDVTSDGLVWIPLLGSLAFLGGIVLGLQGVGRASAGARGMGYAVTGLVLLLGPWALALMAMVVFGILALLGAGPVPG